MSLPSAMSRRLDHRLTLPSARVGVIGAGQLARMLHEAATPLDIEVRVLTDDLGAPAVRAGAIPVIGDVDNLDDLRALAVNCDVVTFDHELVSGPAIEALEELVPVRPSPRALRLAQDKLHARRMLTEAGCPVPEFAEVGHTGDLDAFGAEHGWPVVLKAQTGGYDGRGVWVASTAAEAQRIWSNATASGTTLLVEEHISIDVELSVIVARSPSGFTAVYPPLETHQDDAICREVVLPAAVSAKVGETARGLALSIADGIGLTGVMAVEFFVSGDRVIVNELALRPHNSGHVTIEACPVSQFEQHLRAILDWPLGGTRLLSSSAVMVNVLGGPGDVGPSALLPDALAVPEVRMHLYGKRPREGRKLGHVTALGDSRDETLSRARAAAALLTR